MKRNVNNNLGTIQTVADVFPYLTDMVIENEDVSIESIIDAMYGYGLSHGDMIQNKIEASPFYTKNFTKLSAKEQELLRSSGKKQYEADTESEEDSEEDEAERPNTGGSTKKGSNAALNDSKQKSPSSAQAKQKQPQRQKHQRQKQASPNVPHSYPKRSSTSEAAAVATIYTAKIMVASRVVVVGTFSTAEAAARAHDRAMIRAHGPLSCNKPGVLNFPIFSYASEPMSLFTEFDPLLRKQLFGAAEWTGPKPCDFGFLLTDEAAAPVTGMGFVANSNVRSARQAGLEDLDGGAGTSSRKKRQKGQFGEPEESAGAGASASASVLAAVAAAAEAAAQAAAEAASSTPGAEAGVRGATFAGGAGAGKGSGTGAGTGDAEEKKNGAKDQYLSQRLLVEQRLKDTQQRELLEQTPLEGEAYFRDDSVKCSAPSAQEGLYV
jgi:hypothetical protein